MRAKKSLGQNFLTSSAIARAIVDTANVKENDVVLEIGPGRGILTEILLEKFLDKTRNKSGKVIAVEKDGELVDFLKEKFAEEIKNNKLKLIHDDILTFGKQSTGLFSEVKPPKYKIVANIPYYITGELLRKFLSSDIQPSTMTLLVQKEVAERIARSPDGRAKKESILSISIKAYGEPKYIKTVKAGNFNPKPKVDSAILLIDNISKDFFNNIIPKARPLEEGEKLFFGVVKKGFAHKRKFLISNLSGLTSKAKPNQDDSVARSGKAGFREKLETIFDKLNINKKIRAEDISIEQWKSLTKAIFK